MHGLVRRFFGAALREEAMFLEVSCMAFSTIRRVTVPGVVVPAGPSSGGVLELVPNALSARAWVEGLGLEPGLAALVRFLGGWWRICCASTPVSGCTWCVIRGFRRGWLK